MNVDLESGLYSYFSTVDELSSYSIHKGTDGAIQPDEQGHVICVVDKTTHVVGPLHLATARIEVHTPAMLEDAIDTHTTAITAIRTALTESSDSVAQSVTGFGIRCAGINITGQQDAPSNERWSSAVEFTMGADTSYTPPVDI